MNSNLKWICFIVIIGIGIPVGFASALSYTNSMLQAIGFILFIFSVGLYVFVRFMDEYDKEVRKWARKEKARLKPRYKKKRGNKYAKRTD